MLLTIRNTQSPATDLGFLLHKHPDNVHTREYPFGHATVFYPEASDDACTAAVLLDVDPVGMVRGRGGKRSGPEEQYVNDRPYVASSHLSVVLARSFGAALGGRCERRPELDDQKHYWVGDDEVEKLLRRGEGWLEEHPARDTIVQRYLAHQRGLVRDAIARLTAEDQPDEEAAAERKDEQEASIERPISLNERRLDSVLHALKESGASRVLDLGCGEGRLLRRLLADRQFTEIVGLDVSSRTLDIAESRIERDRRSAAARQQDRLRLIHGSLMYRDARLAGFDAAAVVEVVEHLDPPRLRAFERVLFESARPATIVMTTPNAEYNVMWPSLPAGRFRHQDHRFEWTRAEFENWASKTATRHGYAVTFQPVGDENERVGAPTQMAVFTQGFTRVVTP